MLAIDREAEKIRRRDRLIHQLYLLVITFGLIIIILCGMIWAMTRTAAARDDGKICLTYKQARDLWPKRHLWWYGKDHCWSNRRGGPPRGIKLDPVLNNSLAETQTFSFAKLLPEPVYDVLPRPRPKEADEFVDYCCWPRLETLIDVGSLANSTGKK